MKFEVSIADTSAIWRLNFDRIRGLRIFDIELGVISAQQITILPLRS